MKIELVQLVHISNIDELTFCKKKKKRVGEFVWNFFYVFDHLQNWLNWENLFISATLTLGKMLRHSSVLVFFFMFSSKENKMQRKRSLSTPTPSCGIWFSEAQMSSRKGWFLDYTGIFRFIIFHPASKPKSSVGRRMYWPCCLGSVPHGWMSPCLTSVLANWSSPYG